MVTVSCVGASQARVMNLVLVITASRPWGGPGRPLRPLARPNNEMGRGVVTRLESAATKNEKNKLE